MKTVSYGLYKFLSSIACYFFATASNETLINYIDTPAVSAGMEFSSNAVLNI